MNNMEHFIRLKNFLGLPNGFMYIDTRQFLADSLFYKRHIYPKYNGHMAKDGEKYIMVFIKVKRKDLKLCEEALNELKDKMLLCGYNDYEEHCHNLVNNYFDWERRRKNGFNKDRPE